MARNILSFIVIDGTTQGGALPQLPTVAQALIALTVGQDGILRAGWQPAHAGLFTGNPAGCPTTFAELPFLGKLCGICHEWLRHPHPLNPASASPSPSPRPNRSTPPLAPLPPETSPLSPRPPVPPRRSPALVRQDPSEGCYRRCAHRHRSRARNRLPGNQIGRASCR